MFSERPSGSVNDVFEEQNMSDWFIISYVGSDDLMAVLDSFIVTKVFVNSG